MCKHRSGVTGHEKYSTTNRLVLWQGGACGEWRDPTAQQGRARQLLLMATWEAAGYIHCGKHISVKLALFSMTWPSLEPQRKIKRSMFFGPVLTLCPDHAPWDPGPDQPKMGQNKRPRGCLDHSEGWKPPRVHRSRQSAQTQRFSFLVTSKRVFVVAYVHTSGDRTRPRLRQRNPQKWGACTWGSALRIKHTHPLIGIHRWMY